jgi:hypothetical protein
MANAGGEHRPKRSTELRIATMQHITTGMNLAKRFLRPTTSDLFDPFFIRMCGGPGDLHASALQMEKEEHIIGHETSPTEYLGANILPGTVCGPGWRPRQRAAKPLACISFGDGNACERILIESEPSRCRAGHAIR